MKNYLQTVQSKADHQKSEKISTSIIQTDTKKTGLSKTQPQTPQPQVVRHKIYQIKPMQMVSSQSITSNDRVKRDNQVLKKENNKNQEIKEKEMKAISNVFGQFFKVENLRYYSKPAQTDKVKVQDKSEEQKVESAIELKTKTEPITYQHRVIKRINTVPNQMTELKILFNQDKSISKIEKNKEDEQHKIQSAQKQKGGSPISEISKEQSPSKNDQERKDLKQQQQVRYSELDFKLCEVQQPQVVQEVTENHQIKLNLMLSLGNLQLQLDHIKNNDFTNPPDEIPVHTPSFQMKRSESQNYQGSFSKMLYGAKINEGKRQFAIFDEDQTFSEQITPIKKVQDEQSFRQEEKSRVLFKQDLPIQNIVNNPSSIKQKETSSDEEVFIKSNAESNLQIHPLPYQTEFESLQQVSNNMINQMDKQQENKYISQIVDLKIQQEWRQRMFGKAVFKNKLSSNQQKYEIKLPQPTKSSSPSKYTSYLINYEEKSPKVVSKQRKCQQNVLIRNKTPLKLPVFEHKKVNSHVKFDADINNSNGQYVNDNIQTNRYIALSLQSAQKSFHSETRPSHPFNQSLTVEEEPPSVMQSIENQRSNIEQIQQIREFYNYLRSRQSTYYGNSKNHSPYHESLPQSYEQEGKDTDRNSKSMNKTYQNLHEIKETQKPLITVQSARSYHIPDLDQNLLAQQRFLSKDQKQTRKLYSKEKKSLESVVLSFRRNNYTGDHKNFKDEVVSLSQNEEPHYSFIEQPKEKLSIYTKDPIHIEANHVTFNIKANEGMKSQFKQNIFFPIQKIQPIKVTSMSKTVRQKANLNKSPEKKEENLPTSRKIKVVSVNFTPTSKPIQISSILKPEQISSFLLNSSHIGSFMLNNVIKNYIDAHPVKDNNVEVSNTKFNQNSLNDKNGEENQTFSTKKKKISIKKNGISTKKLSINQKPCTKSSKTVTSKIQKDSISIQSQFHQLNPQLYQTISRINHHKEKELYQIIKSRITERPNSQNSSFYKSAEDSSKLPASYHKGHHSNQKDNSLVKSRNSSKSSKKSGLQLWNSGLSELKSSRRMNHNKELKIFNQQNTRKDEKIIGITKWNENISRYKQSRSKSKQSNLSSTQKRKYNTFDSQLPKINESKKQSQQKLMNIEIKKYKYQVSNVQKKYFN